jgi:hypothetical protein
METGTVVILWWNTEIRILTRDGRIRARSVEGRGDPIAAILELLEECPGTDTVRVVYHPANLDAYPLPCPNTSRSRLKAVFSGEHRALSLPHAVWSVEEVRRNLDGDGYNTILYIDNRSRVPRLMEACGARGIEVEGIWPIQTLIEECPPCSTADFGFISVLVLGSQSAVSCVRPNGGRYLRIQDGPESVQKAAADLNAALALFDGAALPVGLLMVEGDRDFGPLREAAGDLALTSISLGELLANAQSLKPGGFSDFRPRRAVFKPTGPELAALAGAMLLAASVWFAYNRYENQSLWQRRLEASRIEHAELEQLVNSRRAIKDRIARLNQAIGVSAVSPQRHYELLLAIGQAAPVTLSLQSFVAEGDQFEIKGRTFEGVGDPDSPLSNFCRLLPAKGPYWEVRTPVGGAATAPSGATASTDAAAGFTLRGKFAMARGAGD